MYTFFCFFLGGWSAAASAAPSTLDSALPTGIELGFFCCPSSFLFFLAVFSDVLRLRFLNSAGMALNQCLRCRAPASTATYGAGNDPTIRWPALGLWRARAGS